MKDIFYAPAALARFADILECTIQNFGEVQVDACTARLAARIEALAAGTGPRARPCELLMQGVRDASGLTWYREGSHFLTLREKSDTLEVVEILHGRMNLDEHLERLAEEVHLDGGGVGGGEEGSPGSSAMRRVVSSRAAMYRSGPEGRFREGRR